MTAFSPAISESKKFFEDHVNDLTALCNQKFFFETNLKFTINGSIEDFIETIKDWKKVIMIAIITSHSKDLTILERPNIIEYLQNYCYFYGLYISKRDEYKTIKGFLPTHFKNLKLKDSMEPTLLMIKKDYSVSFAFEAMKSDDFLWTLQNSPDVSIGYFTFVH